MSYVICHLCSGNADKQQWIQAVLSVGSLRESTCLSWPPRVDALGAGGDIDCISSGKCIFDDITQLHWKEAKCCRHGGGACDVPSVDLLVVGTSCKDLSKLNHTPAHDSNRPVLEQNSSRGASAQTFQGLLGYVRSHRPLFVIYENVDAISDQLSSTDDSNLKVCLNEFCSLGYHSQPMMTDALEFGLPCHRRRVYILFIDSRSPRLDLRDRPFQVVMSKFRHLVSSCIRTAPCASEVLLEKGDLATKECMDERQAKLKKTKSQTQKAQNNWVNQHMKFADSLGVRWGTPARKELAQNAWYSTLTEREADCLKLSEIESPGCGFRNLSQSLGRANSATLQADGRHVAPTMLPGQLLWTHLASGGPRLMSGYEALLMQGYPIGPCLNMLSQEGYVVSADQVTSKKKKFPTDAFLQDLAGNGMALPVVMAVVQACLAAVHWRPVGLKTTASSVATAMAAMSMLTPGPRPGKENADEDEDI